MKELEKKFLKKWAQLYNLIEKGYVRKIGENRWTKYLIVEDSSLFQNREQNFDMEQRNGIETMKIDRNSNR